MIDAKEYRVSTLKQANRNTIARAIVILLIEADILTKSSDTPLRNIDLFNANTGLGLIQHYWETYNFKKIGLLYPCSSDLHLKQARNLLLDANFQERSGIGLYKPTVLGMRVIEYLKNKYIKKVRGLTITINVDEEIISSFVKIACTFLNINDEGCLKDPHDIVYKVYDVENSVFDTDVIDAVLKDFSDYVEW